MLLKIRSWQFRQWPARLRLYPEQGILGSVMIGIGLRLIHYDNYFVWPPFLLPSANDDGVGMLYVLAGISMIIWVLYSHRTAKWNTWQLTAALYLMAALTIYQFLHWVVLGLGMPFITNAGLTGWLLLLARRSDAQDD